MVALAAAWLPLSDALAQDRSLATTVVSSTRTPTRVDDQLGDITVLDRAAIRRSGVSTFPELLNMLPGVQATPDTIRGATTSVFIRGASNSQALVLVDGQRISSATAGGTALQHIPLEQVERIEVLRGPASSLYGSDAIGGVIQIFTRQGDGAPRASASLTGGSDGTVGASVGYGGQVGDTRFAVNAGAENSRGFSDIRAPRGGFLDSYNPDDDGYRQRNLGFNLSRKVNEALDLGLNYLITEGAKRSDSINCDAAFTVCTAAYDNRDRQRLHSLALRAGYQVSPEWRMALRLGISEDDLRNWRFDPGASAEIVDRYTTRERQASWQNDIKLGPGVLMAALEWRGIEASSTVRLVASSQDTVAAILGYQAWVGPHLVQGSVRQDNISGVGNSRTGTLAYGYRFAEGWIARASAGTGFHAPTFNDLYWPLDPANFFQGNPNLRPERSRNSEVGLVYEQGDTRASLTVYRNRVRDLIEFVADPATFLVSPVNASSATLQGATLEGRHKLGQWALAGRFDLLDAKNDRTGATLQRRVPRSATFDLARTLGAHEVAAQLQAYSARYNDTANTQRLPGFALLNLRASFSLGRHWSLAANLRNVLDKEYVVNRVAFAPFSDYGTAGRSLLVTLRYEGL